MPEFSGIEFSLLSPAQVRKLSVVEVIRPELYDADGYPVEQGVVDPRMGVVDPGITCRTCGQRIGECMGHFGHIELVKPVVHPVLAPKIYLILQSTCRKCGRILYDVEGVKEIIKKSKEKCAFCGAKKQKIKFVKPTTFLEDKEELTVEEIREWLEKIPDEDLNKLKFKGGRPEWMIITILPVPPMTMRPSIILETGERSEDDLTHKIVDIVRINERLKRILDIGAPDFLITDIIELLQYHVATYIKNDLVNIPPARHRSGRPLKTLAQRLVGKEGRFRYNLTGKRVNFSARSVISPDNFVAINEVGIPKVIAKVLTVPERVTEENIEKMRKLILNGDNYPGANYVVRLDGLKKRITEETKEMIAQEIIPGYIVERHLQDGDWVIFNRQPSLHRMSMMGHKARIMGGRTFRLHLAVTTPYNADFDGDEMNLYVPQTEEARAEIKHLMDVYKHIRTPRYGLPIIGLKHDHIIGTYLLTKEDLKLSKNEVANLLAFININKELDKDFYTGKEIFSLLLPNDLNFRGNTKTGEEVVIENGILKKGYIDEKLVGAEKGELLNKIELLYGEDIAAKFIEDLVRVSLNFLMTYSYTISVRDYSLSKEDEHRIEKIVTVKIRDYIIDPTEDRQLELERVLKDVEKIIKEKLSKDSSARIAAETGARGSLISVSQIIGCVSQEKLKGKRITRGYYGRTLPHFKLRETNPCVYGFVKNGYLKGISPTEFFFDAMHGREGLSDTALKTKHSGYLERRLVNSLHDLIIRKDGTIRNEADQIIQFIPFENNINPYRANKGKISLKDILC
ncbi:MAG TPA: DNA-directed RNA polymerase subunit A' [Candidatus Aenigmarchaeota archaeon]|nr:DNA-directed RNA polymerase subunit A' [Candidatus Aenigmarchaeota archaeon]